MNLSNWIGAAIALAILAHAGVLLYVNSGQSGRYELQTSALRSFVLVLDTKTGEIWRHYAEHGEMKAPTRIASPVEELRRLEAEPPGHGAEGEARLGGSQ